MRIACTLSRVLLSGTTHFSRAFLSTSAVSKYGTSHRKKMASDVLKIKDQFVPRATVTAPRNHRKALINALVEPKPFCAMGTWGSIPADQMNVYFRGGTNPIEWANFTSEDLQSLVKACQPATFGRNSQDVLDEAYRKAGKLDKKDFAINLDLVNCGLLEKVRQSLFGLEDNIRPIKADLYKLNVYGPGSFFKTHKDTPRGSDMFGSLIIVFPIKHVGGSLHLRHNGEEIIHDAGNDNLSVDQVSWAAFFGDVEHEVKPVTSGHRVTITYNLRFSPGVEDPPPSPPSSSLQGPIFNALQALLDDKTALPNGGYLGFGLSHQYPLSPDSEDTKALKKVLKGRDAALFNACKALGLDVCLKVVYQPSECGGEAYMTDRFFDGNRGEVEYLSLVFEYDMKGICFEREQSTDDENSDREERPGPDVIVDRIYPKNDKTSLNEPYAGYYGNDGYLGWMYGAVNLVVKIGSYGDRISRSGSSDSDSDSA